MNEVVLYGLIRLNIQDILLGGRSWQINMQFLYSNETLPRITTHT